VEKLSSVYSNKRHWNTVLLDDSLSDEQIEGFILDSYQLVVKGLRKADRERVMRAFADLNRSKDA
jgi:predicted DNA-binding protein (MmcQ/YjbR family)